MFYFISMDECEALCNRLTVMVDGQMQCIGSIQYLKNHYGQGFTVMVNLRNVDDDSLTEIKSEIERQFAPDIQLDDEHKVKYNSCILLGIIFNDLKSFKYNLIMK